MTCAASMLHKFFVYGHFSIKQVHKTTVFRLYLYSTCSDLRMPLPPLFDNNTPLRMIHFLFW